MSFVGFPYFCFVPSGGSYLLAIWVIQSDFSKSQTKDFQTVRSDYLHIYIYAFSHFWIPNRQGDRAWGDTSGSEQLRLTIPEALLGFSPT